GVGPIGTGAACFQVLDRRWKKREVNGGKSLLDICWHLACQQFSRKERLCSHGLRDFVPVFIRKWFQANLDVVGSWLRTLYLRCHNPWLYIKRDHLPLACIGAATRETRTHAERFQHVNPAFRPPCRANGSPLAFRLDTAL